MILAATLVQQLHHAVQRLVIALNHAAILVLNHVVIHAAKMIVADAKADADAHAAATTVFADQNANVLGGKFLKTKLAATNATTNAAAVYQLKELTGTNSGQTDVLLRMLDVTIANVLVTKPCN